MRLRPGISHESNTEGAGINGGGREHPQDGSANGEAEDERQADEKRGSAASDVGVEDGLRLFHGLQRGVDGVAYAHHDRKKSKSRQENRNIIKSSRVERVHRRLAEKEQGNSETTGDQQPAKTVAPPKRKETGEPLRGKTQRHRGQNKKG